MQTTIKSLTKHKSSILFIIWELFILFITVHLIFYYRGYHSYRLFVLIVGFIIAVMSASIYLCVIKNRSIETLYIIIAIFSALIFNLMIPVYCVPDEQIHFWEAYQLSNYMMFVDSSPTQVTMQTQDAELPVDTEYSSIDKINSYYNKMNNSVGDTTLITTAYYCLDTPFYLYFFPAIGITVARLLGLNSILLFMTGRMFNAIFFIICAYWSIRKTPIGKTAFLCVALLPMSLQQTTSISYDCPILASALIVFAYTLRLLSDEIMKKYDWVILFLGISVLFQSKHHAYFIIALLPLLGLKKYLKTNKKTARLILAVIITGIVFSIFVYLWDNVLFAVERAPAYNNGYSEYYSIQSLINNPAKIWILIESTFRCNFGWYFSSMIGESLGWFNISAPSILTYLGLIILILAGVRRKQDLFIVNKIYSVLFIASFVITFAMICGGMLLAWTSIDSDTLEGVQAGGHHGDGVAHPVLFDIFLDNKIIFADMIWLCIFIFSLMIRFLA